MSIKLYMDHHVRRAVTTGLRLRGIDVLTAFEDHFHELEDTDLLDRAGKLNRVLFTQDEDLLVEAARRQRQGIPFNGVIYAHQPSITVGACIEDLELLARITEPAEFMNWVQYLPL